ncbi:MAG: DUF5067 domain-containing protein [Peptostreptococcaceae bacterium]|nr:DUF5067 domain-containing protein [Peptostreptococcaceae bacterium]
MKKFYLIICTIILSISLVACGEPQHKLVYEKSQQIKVADEYNCVAVYTQYTNASSESAIPADNLNVKAYQNGVELPPIVPTGDRTNGYIQCDASVQAGKTAKVIWLFQLDDKSKVSIELPDGKTEEVSL